MTSGTPESSHLKPWTGGEGTLGMPQSWNFKLCPLGAHQDKATPLVLKQVRQLGTKSSACEPKGAVLIRAATEFQVIVRHRWEVTARELEELVTIRPQSKQQQIVVACAQLSLLLQYSGSPSQGTTPSRVGRSPQISLVQGIPHKHSQRLFQVILDCIKLTVKTSIAHRVFLN